MDVVVPTMPKSRYEVLGNLGCGATSRVDKARDTVLGRTVALKTLVHAFGAPTEQKQFLREAQIVSQLSHPSIINLYDVEIEEGNVAFLVMEYVPGKTLQQVLSESTVPVPRACSWAADLAGALSRAHKSGILHGDVKPANILVTEDGNVKLGDFGIARFATQVSGSGRMMGTPAYLSPEQILGEPQNTRSDLFSLGIVLYQMVTGVAPFEGSSVSAVCAQILSAEPVPPSQRNPALPAGLDHVILRCMAKTSADRYPSAEAFAASLYPFTRQSSVASDAIAAAPKQVAPPRRKASWLARPMRPSDLWVLAALALVTIGVPIARALRTRFQLPPAPVMAKVAPRAPEDLLGELQTTTVPDAAENFTSEPAPVINARKSVHQRTEAAIARSAAIRGVVPASTRNASVTTPESAPVLPVAPLANPISHTTPHAALRIEIDSTVGDGALAIFADQNLLYTTELHANTPAQPVKLEQSLPSGPHQLRVALYRADKSLQVAKEGLGEIHTDATNLLRIHVTRKAKMLVKHENGLDVVWPSAMAPTPLNSAAANYAAASK